MGVLQPFRRYRAGAGRARTASSCGSRRDDRVLLVDVPSPALDADDLLVLGEPELKAPSGLDVFHVQLAWPSRGLAAHVSEADGTVRALYAFAPMAGEDYMRVARRGAGAAAGARG